MLTACPVCRAKCYAPYGPALQRVEDSDGVVHEMCADCLKQWNRTLGRCVARIETARRTHARR